MQIVHCVATKQLISVHLHEKPVGPRRINRLKRAYGSKWVQGLELVDKRKWHRNQEKCLRRQNCLRTLQIGEPCNVNTTLV